MRDMKFSIISVWLMALGLQGNTQNKTIKLYLQQIAANKVYIEYLQKGYKIARKGLNLIGDIKNGHFGLDKNFFSVLDNVNPKIRDYAKVAGIINLNFQIVKRYKEVNNQIRSTKFLTEQEIVYARKVLASVLDDCNGLMDELIGTVKNSSLKMSDDERLKRIDVLYSEMQGNFKFVVGFSNEISIMKVQREKDSQETLWLDALY